MNIEWQYLDLVENILEKGIWKSNRTGVKCKTVSGATLIHDMSEGFPLMTHRRLPIKSTLIELEGFLNGVTSKKWFQERGCKYWDLWCNPEKLPNYMDDNCKPIRSLDITENDILSGKYRRLRPEEIKQFQIKEDDLGPLGYSWQFRRFGEQYTGTKTRNGTDRGFDQLQYVCELLKNDPNSRRMVVSYWNPNQLHMMALPPCHTGFQLNHIDGMLNLTYTQRSVDLICNQTVVTYAALLLLFCKFSGLTPGRLTANFEDVHIYENHIEGANEIISRMPCKLPTLEITNNEPFILRNEGLYVNWTHKDYQLQNYLCHTPIKFDVVM